jgi:hypothetical protein
MEVKLSGMKLPGGPGSLAGKLADTGLTPPSLIYPHPMVRLKVKESRYHVSRINDELRDLDAKDIERDPSTG